jgi:Uma2 family endonuclease
MTTAHALPPDPIAPWAEVVPTPGPVTVDILLALPDDGYVYEVVEGVLVRVAGSGNRATTIGLAIGAELRAYVRPRRLGVATGADGVYKFPGAETGLIPDAGYYSAERAARIEDEDKPLPFAPDLAVEVASPSQNAEDMAAKARLYLSAGTRLIWVVWPHGSHVDVWRPENRTRPVRTLTMADVLDGEDVIPGFSYPVAEIFADPLR